MITSDYLNRLAQKIGDDIDVFKVDGETVPIEAIDVDGSHVTVTTSQEFYTGIITEIELQDDAGEIIYQKTTSLTTVESQRIALAVSFDVAVKEAE